MVVDSRASKNERAQIKEGRDFFNEEPKSEYYKPYTYRTHCKASPDANLATGFDEKAGCRRERTRIPTM